MIVEETILREIFLQLPDYVADTSKPELAKTIRYEWGSQPDLIKWLKTIEGNKYPLVWLENGKSKNDRQKHTSEKKCRLILANLSEKQNNRNPSIWDDDFVKCLNPLLDNVLKSLERSGVTTILNTFDVYRDANYTEEDLNKATDFWNVIVLDIDILFKEKANGEPLCINSNIFKNGK